MTASHRYVLVDVFTDRPLEGNPLAVFPEGDTVPAAVMPAIARELNLSETAFVTAAEADAYDVRIFTPAEELPFAGHPTLGTAWVLRNAGRIGGDRIVQRSAAGETPVRFAEDVLWLERSGSVADPVGEVATVASALGLRVEDIGCDASAFGRPDVRLAPAESSAGVSQLMVPLAGIEVLERLVPQPAVADLADDGAYCFAAAGPGRIVARFFAPGIGVAEDAATGSAAAALGLYVSRWVGDATFEIAQGAFIGRPSRLLVEAAGDRVEVGGSVVAVGEGRLSV